MADDWMSWPWADSTEVQLELGAVAVPDDAELAALQLAAGPGWRCWRWAGRLYARRLKTSPAVTKSGTAVEVLAAVVEHDEGKSAR